MKDNIKHLNIALPGSKFRWGGGSELLRLIIHSLHAKKSCRSMDIFLLLPDLNNDKSSFFGATKIKHIIKKIIATYNKRNQINDDLFDGLQGAKNKIKIVYYKNSADGLIDCLRKINADIIFPTYQSFGSDFQFPWIGYIYDLQHKYFPDLFDNNDIKKRDEEFTRVLVDAKSVIVNSHAVKDDIQKFYTNHTCKIFSLPFAPASDEEWPEDFPAEELQKKYSLPEKYLIISNRFWVHKSHITAFEALDKIKNIDLAKNIHIVCTGNTIDSRFPKYFKTLNQKIKSMGIENKIHFLGHIPRRDQIEIMKKSTAVIQPTLFEGGPGGFAVYDAIALGVPVIISDIPVNKEVKGENIFFFKAGSSDDLAKKMIELLGKNIIRPDKEMLPKQAEQNTQAVGNRLLEAIDYTLAQYNRKNF